MTNEKLKFCSTGHLFHLYFTVKSIRDKNKILKVLCIRFNEPEPELLSYLNRLYKFRGAEYFNA